MTPLEPLVGYRVAVTADRRAAGLAELLRRRGAEVLLAPTIATEHLTAEAGVLAATSDVATRPPDLVVANTAIGMRAWAEAAEAAGLDTPLLDALRRSTVIARGPKAAGACHALGVPVAHVVEAERLDGVVDLLLARGVRGRRVVFQRHGEVSPGFIARLRSAGADVVEVPVYSHGLPGDVGPAKRLLGQITGRRLHAVTFTSAPALDNLFTLAEQEGTLDGVVAAFNSGVVAACVGPVCAEAGRARGIADPVYPARGRLGLLVRELCERLAGERHSFEVGGTEIALQGAVLMAGGTRVSLSQREAEVLAVLAARPGATVSRAVLLRRVWPAGADDHVVEVTVGRLRQRLNQSPVRIAMVPSRGYRLTGSHASHTSPSGV